MVKIKHDWTYVIKNEKNEELRDKQGQKESIKNVGKL